MIGPQGQDRPAAGRSCRIAYWLIQTRVKEIHALLTNIHKLEEPYQEWCNIGPPRDGAENIGPPRDVAEWSPAGVPRVRNPASEERSFDSGSPFCETQIRGTDQIRVLSLRKRV